MADFARYYSWKNAFPLLSALSSYRRSLTQPPVAGGVDGTALPRPSSGYGWTKWLRRGTTPLEPPMRRSSVSSAVELARPASPPPPMAEKPSSKHFAKTLRLASDQLVGSGTVRVELTVETTASETWPQYCSVLRDVFVLWDGDVCVAHLFVGGDGPDCDL